MLKRDVVLAQEYLAFLLLNLFDLFLTGYIFNHQGHEANAVAVQIIAKYGYRGLVAYKFFLVVVLVLACEGISKKSVTLAKTIVVFGCCVYVLLVFWEVFLIITKIHMG